MWYCKVHRYPRYYNDKQSAINYGLNYICGMIEAFGTPSFTNLHRAKAIKYISEGKYEEAIEVSQQTGYQYNYLSIGYDEGSYDPKKYSFNYTITQDQIDWAKEIFS